MLKIPFQNIIVTKSVGIVSTWVSMSLNYQVNKDTQSIFSHRVNSVKHKYCSIEHKTPYVKI